jgi:hypothetical protein
MLADYFAKEMLLGKEPNDIKPYKNRHLLRDNP